jgi:hypothetical protein
MNSYEMSGIGSILVRGGEAFLRRWEYLGHGADRLTFSLVDFWAVTLNDVWAEAISEAREIAKVFCGILLASWDKGKTGEVMIEFADGKGVSILALTHSGPPVRTGE